MREGWAGGNAEWSWYVSSDTLHATSGEIEAEETRTMTGMSDHLSMVVGPA